MKHNVENGEPLPSEIAALCVLVSKILYLCLVQQDARIVNHRLASVVDVLRAIEGGAHEHVV